jgi:hypothetical protein
VLYPDLQFATSILVMGEQSSRAAQLLREIPHPLVLSLLHRLQLENALLRLLHGSDAEQSEIARDGLRTWRQYLDEQVFVIQKFELEPAFAKAATWNAGFTTQPPRWGLLAHPAIATTVGATFMSFDPALRKQASAEGLELLPKRL